MKEFTIKLGEDDWQYLVDLLRTDINLAADFTDPPDTTQPERILAALESQTGFSAF